MARTGSWIATFSGGQWFLADTDPADVKIEDIAHALSMICRFTGHVSKFVSVAEHSIRTSALLALWHPDDFVLQLDGLLHDASEAYLGDVSRPLKALLPGYKELEARTMEVIYQGLCLVPLNDNRHELVKHADNILLVTERDQLLAPGATWSSWTDAKPDPRIRVANWSPAVAEKLFLSAYHGLRSKVKATL